MEEYTTNVLQRLRREKENVARQVGGKVEDEKEVLSTEACRYLIENVHKNKIRGLKKKRNSRFNLQLPESVVNRAALSLYRSMVHETAREGTEEVPTRSIKYYTSEKYNKLKDQLLSNELKEDIASGKYLQHLSSLSNIGETLEEWRICTRDAKAGLNFNTDTSQTDTIARLARELADRRQSSTEALDAFYEIFPAHQPGDYVRSLSAALQV